MKYRRGLIALVSFVFLLSVVVALHTISPTFYSINESLTYRFNISVNNTDIPGTGNISQVNITFPSGFTFVSNTFSTSASNSSFTNTSIRASWTNASGLVMNVTNRSFLFNASANTSTVGRFNISVVTVNISGVHQSNITLVVNDTTRPRNISFVSPTPDSNSNVSRNYILVNVSVEDNGAVNVVRIYVFNASHSLVNNTNTTTNPSSANITGLNDGVYYINITANDSFGNQNLTGSGTRTVRLDSTSPSLTVTRSSTDSNTQTIVFTIAATESGSGIAGECTVTPGTGSGGSVTISGADTSSQEITHAGLNCGQAVDYDITCTDRAGNIGSLSSSLSTDECSSGGGSGARAILASWSNTYKDDSTELSTSGVSRILSQKERIALKINGQLHHVGVKSITGNSAVIEVASTPQQVTMSVGESKTFDTNADGKYDLQVTLQSIVNGKANLLVQAISIPVTTNEPTTSQDNTVADEVVAESDKSNVKTIGISILVVLLIIALVVYYFARRR